MISSGRILITNLNYFVGKTSRLDDIIRNKNVLIKNGEKKTNILFFLSEQEIYKKWERDGLLAYKSQGVPDLESFKETISIYGKEGANVIFDDLGAEIKINIKFFRELFLVLSHHLNLNVFLILHSIFPEGLRELSLNTHRFIITHNPRDSLSISTLSRQSFPGSKNFLPSVYKFIGEMEFGYLVLDFHHQTNQALRGIMLHTYILNYIKIILNIAVTTNWFFESGPFIMAFQPTGPCSASPYKCLHVISSDLYKSLLSKNTTCEDKVTSSSNSSSYSAPNIHNNFYPSNGFDFKPDGGNHPDSPDLSPDTPPPPPDLPPSHSNPPSPPSPPSSDETPGNFVSPASPNSVIIQPSNEISSDQDHVPDNGEMEFNGVVSGAGNQISRPAPNPIKELTRRGRFKKKASKKRRTPRNSSGPHQDPPPPPHLAPPHAPYPPTPQPQQNIHKQIPVIPSVPKVEPMEHATSSIPSDSKPKTKKPIESKVEPMDHTASSIPSVSKTVAKKPPSPNGITKLKSELKWPSFEERKPDIKSTSKKTAKVVDKDVKKPLIKRKTKFDRVLGDIMEVEDEEEPANWIRIGPEFDTPNSVRDTHQNEFKSRFKPTTYKKDEKKVKPEKKEPPETDARNDVRDTHQNELRMRFDGAPYVDRVQQRKYPQIKKEPKYEKKESSKKLGVKYKNQKIKVKGPIKVRKDLFTDSTEKVKDRMRDNMFKSNNGSEKKSFSKNNASNMQDDVEFIDVPYMPQHAAPPESKKNNEVKRKSNSVSKMKDIIEGHHNPSAARDLKQEMIESMEIEDTSSKRKNKFPTHPTGPIKFLRTKEDHKGKRKNNFGTHPTGPIKFVKSKHGKPKKEDDEDEKDESSKKIKKVYGHGFKLWKI